MTHGEKRGLRFWARERSFIRLRMEIRVNFTPPQEERRERIWSSLLLVLEYFSTSVAVNGEEAREEAPGSTEVSPLRWAEVTGLREE